MQVDEPALASSSKTKITYITEPNYTDVTRQQPFNYRSLPSHDPAICIDAGMYLYRLKGLSADKDRFINMASWILVHV